MNVSGAGDSAGGAGVSGGAVGVAPRATGTAPGAPDGVRPSDLRMARLHLRMGSLELARAELEATAGAGALDTDALLDLAEVRWRTGDVAGAGVAAYAYLASDRDDVLALVIAAEASSAAGHPGEAREYVGRVLGRDDVDLDAAFAGMPRSWMWPLEPTDEPAPVTDLFPGATRPMAVAGGVAEAIVAGPPDTTPAEVLPAAAVTAAVVAAPEPEPADAERPADPARDHLGGARVALDAGDTAAAADRLGSLLRERPELAASVLAALERAAAQDPP